MRLSIAILLWFFALPAPAEPLALAPGVAAARLAPYVEALEDPDRRLGVADLQRPEWASRFAPLAGADASEANFGYAASVWWLRVTLAPEADGPTEWLLEAAFSTLDLVEVYAPGADQPMRSGDARPFAERPLPHRHFVFPLTLAGREAGPQVVYLRVASSGTLTVPLHLWSKAALHAHDQGAYALHALYFGILLVLGLYNPLLWLSLGDRTYLAYVAFVVAMAAGQLALTGLGYQYVWPEAVGWQAMSLGSSFAATGLFGALFTRLFLDTRRRLPRADRVIRFLAWGFAGAALAPLAVEYRWAAIATSLFGISFSGTAVVCGVLRLRQGDKSARFFLVAWLGLLVGVALMGLRNLGWLPTNFLTTNGIQIGSAIEVLLLSFALADRIQLLRREKEAAQSAALASEHARCEALVVSERSLELRIAQRTHELTESNRRLQESEAQLRELAYRDPLTGLANRSLLFDRLEQALHRGKRNGTGFAVLLIDLDHFKQINDSLGHEAGDEVLRVSGARLRDALRTSDTVCRLGGDELVVLLEDAGELAEILTLGDKLRQILRQPIAVSGTTAQVDACIGIARWPGDGDDPQSLLHAADQAMYQAKRQGRGRLEAASVRC